MNTPLENFEQAFAMGSGGCRRTCDCGKIYFHDDTGYSWEEGELEALEKNPKALGLQYCPSDLSFEGRQYVDVCDCWHKRANHIMSFIDGHAFEIAKYLTLEKARKTEEAKNSPVVDEQA